MRDAFVGIDVAVGDGKPMPICVAVRDHDTLVPLPLFSDPLGPPVGRGNIAVLRGDGKRLASETRDYLRNLERAQGIRIVRIAIDAPSAPRRADLTRRQAEEALDVSCIGTPTEEMFDEYRMQAEAHLAAGGAEWRLPANNLWWMLAGFELFKLLRGEGMSVLEVYPQATVRALGVGHVHKTKPEGLAAQLDAIARHTNWPVPPDPESLRMICHGKLHDCLDAYLAAWIASLDEKDRTPLGEPPGDVIWIPRLPGEPREQPG